MEVSRAIARRFGVNLAKARKRAGLSQEALAVLASLHRTEIGLLERGERLARIDTALKLAGALDVPFDELLAGIEWTPGRTERGAFALGSRSESHAEVMERAAALRAEQSGEVDVVALVREGREDLDRRGRGG